MHTNDGTSKTNFPGTTCLKDQLERHNDRYITANELPYNVDTNTNLPY
jgi:hypothetical protein